MIAGDKKPECEYVYSAEEHRRLTRIADHYPKVVEALEEHMISYCHYCSVHRGDWKTCKHDHCWVKSVEDLYNEARKLAGMEEGDD